MADPREIAFHGTFEGNQEVRPGKPHTPVQIAGLVAELDGVGGRPRNEAEPALDLGADDDRAVRLEEKDRTVHELFTDASSLIGGGYVLGAMSFGQFRWEEAEKRLFASSINGLTDINVLEFVVAVLAIVTEREYLKGSVVLLRVDNMAAVSWLNQLLLNRVWGQNLMRLLITLSLLYNIRVVCLHVPGVNNSVADGLSRYFQDTTDRLLQASLLRQRMPTYISRESWWKTCGRHGLLGEWTQILEQPILRDLTSSKSLVSPWVGTTRIKVGTWWTMLFG